VRTFAILVLAVMAAPAGRGDDLEEQVRALRPPDIGAGSKAVLDDLERRAEAALAGVKHARTREEADAARGALREKLKRSLGFDLLPRAVLDARVTGIVARAGYRIEKIVFESLPGVPVSAHLYVPEGLRGPAPAILFYAGHWWADGKSRPDFQAFCINMARMGFVVLTWDPFGQGERGISSRDHRRTEALLVGVSQQGFAEYETRCALEYLLSRKEVDAGRIGMTGASGGGYNTWITAALDDRIKVAAPVAGTSEFFEQIRVTRPLDWYHAAEHCHFVPGLIRYANNHEFLAMAAPKPLMIIAASRDESFPIAGVKEVYEYGRGLYRAYGAAGKIAFFEDTEEGHGYQKRKREAAYGWFLRWLTDRGDGGPVPEPETVTAPFDAPEMRCFPPGENQAAGPGMIAAVRSLAAGLPDREKGGSFEGAIRWPSGESQAPVAVSAAPVERLLIPSAGLQAPAYLARPGGSVRGILVAVNDAGKEAIPRELPLAEILASGWAVLGLDPRGIGELKTPQMGWAAAVSLLLGENFVGMQAFDIARAVEAGRQAFGGVPAGLYARGDDAALAATYALARSAGVRFYILRNGFGSFRQFYERPRSLAASYELKTEDRDRTTSFDREIPFAYVPFGALRSFDLPDLLAQSQARGLIVQPIDGDWNVTEDDAAAQRRVREFLRAQLDSTRLNQHKVTSKSSPAPEPGAERFEIPSLVEGLRSADDWWRIRRPELLRLWTTMLGKPGPNEKDRQWFGDIRRAVVHETTDRGAYTRIALDLPIEKDFLQPHLLLLPKNQGVGPFPAVICWTSTTPDYTAPEQWWGEWLAGHGYVVLTGWSFIRNYRGGTTYASGAAQKLYERFGHWLPMAKMVHDAQREAEYLRSLPQVDPRRIGFMGFSLSAKAALYVAAFAPEFRATVAVDPHMAVNGGTNWYAPWYLDWLHPYPDIPTPQHTVLSMLNPDPGRPGFEHDHHEILALAAPRALLIIGGRGDSEDSGGDSDDRESWGYYNRAAEVYRLLGVPERLRFVLTEDGHHANGPAIDPAWRAFLERFLRSQ
jgi:dienelactone hydrolase